MTRVLVCGGRDYSDGARVSAVLNKLHAAKGINLIIEGGAKGADYLAHVWACMEGVDTDRYEVFYDRYTGEIVEANR